MMTRFRRWWNKPEHPLVSAGSHLTLGIVYRLTVLYLLVMVALALIKALSWLVLDYKDSTDFVWRDRWNLAHVQHSGMSVRTDWSSGCQFLVSPEGGLTPRLWKLRDGSVVPLCLDPSVRRNFQFLRYLQRTDMVPTWRGAPPVDEEADGIKTKTTDLHTNVGGVQPGARR